MGHEHSIQDNDKLMLKGVRLKGVSMCHKLITLIKQAGTQLISSLDLQSTYSRTLHCTSTDSEEELEPRKL